MLKGRKNLTFHFLHTFCKTRMDYLNLLIGISLVVGALLYLMKIFKEIIEDEDYSLWTYSYDINIVVGILIFLVMGIILIYRELKFLFI